MRKLYLFYFTVLVSANLVPLYSEAQCGSFTATAVGVESRCAATGSVIVVATGGSGNYKYKASGPVNTNFTSADTITGLSAGNYTITVTDINSNCSINIPNVAVTGNYLDPRFTLNSVDVSCDNGSNGSISLANQVFGRAPFIYSIVAPSPAGVGTSNSTGTFNNLSAGVYTIRLTDSCGGMQTRLVTINNYTWKIDSARFTKISCDSATGYIRVTDSRGNISTIDGLPGFTYGIIRRDGDTIWFNNPSFTFYIGNQNTFWAVAKDPCGKVKKFSVTVSFNLSVSNTVNTFNYTCRQFSASVSGVTNFLNPSFCLTDTGGAVLDCNSTGVFHNINYGSYCINAYDSCTDTTISRCFTRLPLQANVAASVRITNKVCADFTASVTGQSGLTNPDYCLYDSLNNLISCNTTGIFNNLPYGSYCITVTDTCRDTTIQRCFTATKPVPVVPDSLAPLYYTCTVFGIQVRGDSLTNPLFCLRDTLGNIVTCNNTGVFDSLAYGDYCISVYDSCYDTTITRCISVAGPVINNHFSSAISNRACSTFTVNVTNPGLLDPQYCIYTSDSTLIACNSTGVFDSLAYGQYYVIAHNSCPDTTFNYNISEYPPLPSLGGTVNISNRACATFSANVGGQQNLNSPQYCLYDSAHVLVSCNSNGSFSNIPYGSYCIEMRDGCYDTLITRCFTADPLPVNISLSSSKSCTYGFAILKIVVSSGVVPFSVTVYNPDGSTLLSGTYNSTTINLDNTPPLATGERYTIVVNDNCGGRDTDSVIVTPSIVSHQARVIPKCPSSTWVNGSGSIETTASSNTGSISVRIIKKNNVTISSISPNNTSGGVSTFNNLGPGTYIIRYRVNDNCSKTLYDTVTIPPYQYPALDRSSAYQCDQGGFSLGAVVSNGVGPFMYEIIGSVPSTPSIITAPQSNPVFTINNGTAYALVRLRAIDACGNASLEDASILPLADNGIVSDYNCFQLYTTLRVDTLYNSTYAWYKLHTVNDTDSTYMGSGYSLYFPSVMPEDTGLYVCHINVNSGCIKRTYYYRLDGSCYHYLPVTLTGFDGRYKENDIQLDWQITGNTDARSFVIEKKTANRFRPVGRVDVPLDAPAVMSYRFIDSLVAGPENMYRLKIIKYNNTFEYSKTVTVKAQLRQEIVAVYPNPAQGAVTIELRQHTDHAYSIQLLDQVGKLMKELSFSGKDVHTVLFSRPPGLANGLYLLRINDLNLNTGSTQKVVFR